MKKLLLLIAMVLTVCSTAMAETLTAESAVGTIGTLNGREAMVVDLGGSIGKVAIATMNLGATDVNDYGTQFSSEADFDPASLNLTDGWYVPTIEELSALKDRLQPSSDNTGLEYTVGESTLFLPGVEHDLSGKIMYVGKYMSSSQLNTIYHSLAFYFTQKIKSRQVIIADNNTPLLSVRSTRCHWWKIAGFITPHRTAM